MSTTCLKKQTQVEALFAECITSEAKYKKIIELGKTLSPLDDHEKTSEHLVKGCQSTTYLVSTFEEYVVRFRVSSDALISAGLAALLLMVYDGEDPETIFTCPPSYLENLGISASLTPNRANGLYSMHLRMKQEALRFLT